MSHQLEGGSIKKVWNTILSYVFLWFSLLFTPCVMHANSINTSISFLTVMMQQLETEERRNAFLSKRLSVLQEAQQMPISSFLTKKVLQRLKTSLIMIETEHSHTDLVIKTAQLELELTQSTIQTLQKRNTDIRRHLAIASETESTLRDYQKLFKIQQKRLQLLHSNSDLLYRTITLTREWNKKLQIQMQLALEYEQHLSFNSLLNRLQKTQVHWKNQLHHLSRQINHAESYLAFSETTNLLLVLNTIIAEEKSNVLAVQLHLETIEKRVQQLHETLLYHPPLMILNTLQKPLETFLTQIQTIEELLQKKTQFLKNCCALLQNNEQYDATHTQSLLKLIEKLHEDYQKQSSQTTTLRAHTESELSIFTQQLHAYLGNRQDLPGFDVRVWLSLTERLKEVPKLLKERVIGLIQLILLAATQASRWKTIVVIGVLLLWLRISILIKRFLRKRLHIFANTKKIIPATLSSFFIQLTDWHLYRIVLWLSLWSVLTVYKVPFHTFSWILNLAFILVLFSVAIKSCRFWLMETVSQEKRFQNAALCYRLQSVLWIGEAITLFSLIAHQVILDYEVRDLVARLFMLFLLVIALLLFRIWLLVPKLLENYFFKRPRYLKQVIHWASFLLPMSLFLNAILGLVGYVQLAWAVIGYQSILLMALAIYPLLKGLMTELFNWLSEQSIRRFRNGWLWSEALLKPLYQILTFMIFAAIIFFLFSIIGWKEQLFTMSADPAIWLNKQLLIISDIPITLLKLIRLAVMSAMVVWLSRWTREFAYRSIFSNLKDLGLRNSLSILTQYIAVLSGILFTLQAAGLTLSVLKYIVSGFAIGLSFGLRDLLNNFVTGVLLLVERPLKVGDWVTIGDYNGQVMHIGARSITVNTEEHQELMVPNADLFYKHFVNWTRHDSVIRLSVPLSINRVDDPIRVKEVILEAVFSIPKILHHPSPSVYFKSTDQILLTFRIDYYIDLTKVVSRSDVNSQLLFALWQYFEKANISSPRIVQSVKIEGDISMKERQLATELLEENV